jgi:hypothetical protein
MVICLRHFVKLGETLFDNSAHLVVLGRFHCSQQGDVRTAGMDFRFEESLTLYKRACDGYSKVLGEHHPTTRACQQHRSEVLKSQEQSSVVFSAPDKSVSAPTRIVSRLSRGLAHLGIGGSKHKKSQEGST